MKYLQIAFTIVSALCIAAVIPCGLIFGWQIATFCIIGAFSFYVFMLLCKQSAQSKEEPCALPPDPQEKNTDDQ